jgi:hypothetical protein
MRHIVWGLLCAVPIVTACKSKAGAPDAKPAPVPAIDASVADASPPVDAAPPPDANAGSAAPAAPASPFATGDKWTGTYTCGSAKPTTLTLVIKGVSGAAITAEFDFVTSPAKKQGQFTMKGSLKGQHLHLKFGKWIKQPSGFAPADLDGKVSADGNTYSGSVIAPSAHCKTFSVHK